MNDFGAGDSWEDFDDSNDCGVTGTQLARFGLFREENGTNLEPRTEFTGEEGIR